MNIHYTADKGIRQRFSGKIQIKILIFTYFRFYSMTMRKKD